jgi:hypothetical protein
MTNTLQENLNKLEFIKTSSYMKMQATLCNHAIGIVRKTPVPVLGCPQCQYVLEPEDEVDIVRGTGVELCRTTAKELLR